MKKLSLLFVAMCVMLSATVAQVSVWDGTHTTWTNGAGTEANPYLIENAAQLAHLAYYVNNGTGAGSGNVVGIGIYWKLTTNINLNSLSWNPIGYFNSTADQYFFGGHLDGSNHSIANLVVSGVQQAGLFGQISGGSVKNIGITGTSSVSSSTYYSGGIIGFSTGTVTISNCYNTGAVSANSSSYSGGLMGYNTGTVTITNCYNTGTVSSPYSGGIIGYNTGTVTITNCYNIGTISGYYSSGIMGYNYNGTVVITNCYNTGTTSSGIMGSGSGTITNCYNIGTATNAIRGSSGTTTNCFYLNTCSSNNTYGGVSKTEVFMKTQEFVNELGYGFKMDVGNTNNGYPVLTNIIVNIATTAATNITQTHATLNGSITYENTTLIAHGFEYKKTSDTEYLSVNATLNNNSLSYTLSGLTPYTIYTYRSFMTFGDYTIYGNNLQFVTQPVTVTTNYATDVTQTKATLHADISIGDAVIETKGYEYKLSTETNYIPINITGDLSSYTLTELLPGKLYQFRAFLTPVGATTIYSNVTLSFNTLPVVATTNPATNITRSGATLNGTTDSGDATIIKQGFILGNDTIDVSNSMTTLTYNVTNLPRSTTFFYQTYCTTAGGTVFGAVQQFTTLAFNQDGTALLIENQEDLILFANLVNGGNAYSGQEFILANNIILPVTPNNILSIGTKSTNRPFSGVFNGNNKLIYNVYIDNPNTEYQGLFGYTKDAHIKELGLVDITASGRNYTGGMVGYAENTRLDNSYIEGGTLFALSYCGGLVGYQTSGTNSIITGCHNSCTVTGNHYVGGLLGYSFMGTVRNSYVICQVTGYGNAIGAIIGGAREVLSYNCWFNEEIIPDLSWIGEHIFKSGDEWGMTSEDMRKPEFVTKLNQGLISPMWKMDYNSPINNGFPILIWQTAINPLEIATLSSLTVSKGALSPAFNNSVHEYTVEVANNVAEITITATATHPNATIAGTGVKPLAVGANLFNITVTAADGVTKLNYTVTVNRNNVGIVETHNCASLRVYPNPTTGELTINNEQLTINDVEVFDIYGRKQSSHHQILSSSHHLINIAHLPSGIYFVKISTEAGEVVKKVVKE